jgi:hypothetical protein
VCLPEDSRQGGGALTRDHEVDDLGVDVGRAVASVVEVASRIARTLDV